MSQEQINFKQISAKLVGSNVVCFRLEDETLLKVHIDVGRIGVAIDRKSPDGTPIYNINVLPRIEIELKDKMFTAPIPSVPTLGNGKNNDSLYAR